MGGGGLVGDMEILLVTIMTGRTLNTIPLGEVLDKKERRGGKTLDLLSVTDELYC